VSWEQISDSEILNFTGTRDNPTTAQYERILQKRQTAALIEVKDQLNGLMETVDTASQGLQSKADKLSDAISLASEAVQQKSDQLSAQYQRISDSQSRHQRAILWLTAVVGAATIAYTVITWESVKAMREANEIQEHLIDLQASGTSHQADKVRQATEAAEPPHR
jgi:uncharacterized phage infection (PIP) family protein YhgE